jgi:hypothetical protein
VSVLVGITGIGESVNDGIGISEDESNTPGLHDANESSIMSMNNVLTLMFLHKRAS